MISVGPGHMPSVEDKEVKFLDEIDIEKEEQGEIAKTPEKYNTQAGPQTKNSVSKMSSKIEPPTFCKSNQVICNLQKGSQNVVKDHKYRKEIASRSCCLQFGWSSFGYQGKDSGWNRNQIRG